MGTLKVNSVNINGTEYVVGSLRSTQSLEEQSLYVNPNYFKNYKFAGGFAYIDFKKNGKVEDVHIKEVLYKNPVVVVFWSDGTKTTSRADNGDAYNPDAGLALCVLQFGLYKKVVDKFFKEETGHNVAGFKKPTGEVKRRIIFNGHPDGAWDWPFKYKFTYLGFDIHMMVCFLGAFYTLGLGIAKTLGAF